MSQPTPHEDFLDVEEDRRHSTHNHADKTTKSEIVDSVTNPPSPPTSPPKGQVNTEHPSVSCTDPLLYAEETHHYRFDAPLFPQDESGDISEDRILRKESIADDLTREILNEMDAYSINGSVTSPHTSKLRKPTATFVSVLHSQDPRKLRKEIIAGNNEHYGMAQHPRNVRPIAESTARATPAPKISVQASQPPAAPSTMILTQRRSTNRVTKPMARRRVTTLARASTPSSNKAAVDKKIQEHDFEKIEDICPPISTLDNRHDAFDFVAWNGTPIDLSNDPNRHLLHAAEIRAAEKLRLECDRWLVTKRRIFLSVRDCHRNGKAFKKTDAQKASFVDVNKASRLWEAFKSVGWFDAEFFPDS